jgi:uncharacterized protein YodC (DUF2158 family)
VIDIDALKIGDVVQLASGSPYMTVRGFKPVVGGPPGRRPPPAARTHVVCVVWSHRLGFVKEDFRPEELRFPPPREPRPDADDEAAG